MTEGEIYNHQSKNSLLNRIGQWTHESEQLAENCFRISKPVNSIKNWTVSLTASLPVTLNSWISQKNSQKINRNITHVMNHFHRLHIAMYCSTFASLMSGAVRTRTSFQDGIIKNWHLSTPNVVTINIPITELLEQNQMEIPINTPFPVIYEWVVQCIHTVSVL